MAERDHLPFPAQRTVIHGDSLAWMEAHPAPARASVVTSLPDLSEIAPHDLAHWRAWFIQAARTVLRWLPADGMAVFYQSDIRHQNVWIDKGYLIMEAAHCEGHALAWHKIVCRRPPGTVAMGRPSYSHMLCLGPKPRPPGRSPGPDVLADAGPSPWTRGMGERACQVACRYLRDEVGARLIVDPFCGLGSVLAVANTLGLASLGVELSGRRCRLARHLQAGGEPAAGQSPADEGER